MGVPAAVLGPSGAHRLAPSSASPPAPQANCSHLRRDIVAGRAAGRVESAIGSPDIAVSLEKWLVGLSLSCARRRRYRAFAGSVVGKLPGHGVASDPRTQGLCCSRPAKPAQRPLLDLS